MMARAKVRTVFFSMRVTRAERASLRAIASELGMRPCDVVRRALKASHAGFGVSVREDERQLVIPFDAKKSAKKRKR